VCRNFAVGLIGSRATSQTSMVRRQRRSCAGAVIWVLVALFVVLAAAGVSAQSADADTAAAKVLAFSSLSLPEHTTLTAIWQCACMNVTESATL